MTGTTGQFTAIDGNLYDAACEHIRLCVSYLARVKAITLTPHEIDTCTEQVADQLSELSLYDVACDQFQARSSLTAIVHDHIRTFYARKLVAFSGELAQRPFITEIALVHHLRMAEQREPHTWPSLAQRSIEDIASTDTGPLVWNFADGVTTTTYHRGLRLHRDEAEGPAFVAVNADGHVIEEEFWRDGCLHRTNGPAKIVTDPITGTTQQTWMIDGSTTRVDAPAYIERAAGGRVLTEMWFANDVFCRAAGPAGIWRTHSEDDTWQMEQFSVDGMNVRTFENGVEVSYV
ncbi:MAG: hypothetical protein ABL904_24260 [Hyphomicrobiaceae bacterium]